MSRLGAAGTIHLLWPSLAGLVLTATINLAPARVANASEGKPPAACRAQVKELSKWLTAYVRGLDSHPDFILVPEDMRLASVARKTAEASSGLVVLVSPDRISVEGEASEEGLGPRIHSALVRDREIAELTHEASSPPVVAVDSRAPWHLAVQAMDGLAAAGVNRVGLAFRSSLVPPVPVPGPSPFDLLVEKARQSNDPAIKQAQLSEMASTLVSACAPLQNPLVTCARRGLARQTLVDAVLSCDCAADVASIKTVIWTLRRPNPGTLVPIDLGSAEGVAVVNQANMAWTFAHKRVLQAAKTMEPLGFSVRR